jgi:hypothetical protein
MSDDDEARKKIERLTTEARSAGKAMFAALREDIRMLAADMGEPLSDDNKQYYDSLAALAMTTELTSGSAELHRVDEIARTVIPRDRNQWSGALAQREYLLESEDQTGETLGFGDLLRHDPNDPDALKDLLRQCATFYRVPSHYAPAIGEAVTAVTKTRGSWYDMPVGWSHTYALVVWAVVARWKPDAS